MAGILTETLLALLLAILPPCPTEDSDWCGWNAQEQGNRTGQSFAALGPYIIH